MSKKNNYIQAYRINFIYLMLVMVVCALVWRVFDLQVFNNDFLQGQGNARVLRQLEVTAHRGMITDRNGYPLAISTPISSIWINPKEFNVEDEKIYSLAKLLQLNSQYIKNKIKKRSAKEFVYIKRRINPDLAQRIMDLSIKGVHTQREYRRYYPDGEIFGHILGKEENPQGVMQNVRPELPRPLPVNTGDQQAITSIIPDDPVFVSQNMHS